MKLSISRAWNAAMGLVQANMGVVAVMAGVFFFLPNLAIVLLMPDMATSMAIEPGTEDPAEVLNQFSEFYAGVWVPMLLVFVAQAIGTLAMLALLRGENRPTVGEALGIGAVGLLTYIGATILVYIALGLVIGIVMGVAIASEITALAVILGILAFVGFVYAAIKISLLAPVIAIERMYNPFSALLRSWKLTKGNSIRLLAFYILFFLAVGVVGFVILLVVTLVFGIAGGDIAVTGVGVFNAILTTVYLVLILGVLAGVHRQLAGPDAEVVSEDFE